MTEFESEHQRHEEGKLGRDFISMTTEAIKFRELIDRIGIVAVSTAVENLSVDDAA